MVLRHNKIVFDLIPTRFIICHTLTRHTLTTIIEMINHLNNGKKFLFGFEILNICTISIIKIKFDQNILYHEKPR